MKSINLLIKPASSLCNLRCRYCFYADEAANREEASMGLMAESTVETLLREAYSMIDKRGFVSFAFQGGEPTVAGLAFFRHFTARARALRPQRVEIAFSIQTNGTLLDEDWARFFREEDYLVGISLDGCPEIHNTHRVDADGKGTWNRIIKKVELLKKHGVRINALCVVTGLCARSPQKAYESLKKLGFEYMQFIACLDPIGEARGSRPWSLKPEAYGRFLCQLFDLWYRDWERGNYHSIRLFDDYIHILLGDGGSTCATCGHCGTYFVVEGNGTVYPCDFYSLDEWKLGRLGEQSLAEIAESGTAQRFLDLGKEKPTECLSCRWRVLCNGGCKNDWLRETDETRNYYCKAFQMLFEYAFERMARIAREEQAQRQYRMK